jgi:hypothetical protein
MFVVTDDRLYIEDIVNELVGKSGWSLLQEHLKIILKPEPWKLVFWYNDLRISSDRTINC